MTYAYQPSSTGVQSVAAVIGLVTCVSDNDCPDVDVRLGQILYQGLYTPEFHDRTGQPYQNFTLEIPKGYNGWVQLSVVQFYLLAVGIFFPFTWSRERKC